MGGDERRPIPFPEGPLPRPWPAVATGIAIAYTLFLLWATHHPKPENLLGPRAPNDKLLHLAAYGALAVLAGCAAAARGGWGPRPAAAWLTLLAAFAAVDEATQPFFGRFADARDWAFDEVGLVLGLAAVTATVAVLRSSAGRKGARRDASAGRSDQ